VVQQPGAETSGGLRVIFGQIADNFGEIVQRPLRVEEAVVHFGKSLRTSSGGTVRPALASRMPSSIAASVSSSSSSRGGASFSRSASFALAMLKCYLGLSLDARRLSEESLWVTIATQ